MDLIRAHEQKQLEYLQRPARQQVDRSYVASTAYVEGQENYNIWYHKYSSLKFEDRCRAARDPAETRCNPATDAGWTKADTTSGTAASYYCFYFAKGNCWMGSECHHRHRVPVGSDDYTLDASVDCFGRERFNQHRDDMGGVGSFSEECRAIYVGRLRPDRTQDMDPDVHLEETVRSEFSEWGPIESLRVIPRKGIAFITYYYRVNAEFAKVSMADQCIGKCGQLINVRWAHEVASKSTEKNSNAVGAKPENSGSFRNQLPSCVPITTEEQDKYLEMYFAEQLQQTQTNIGPPTQEQLYQDEVRKKAESDAQRMASILSELSQMSNDDFQVAL